MSVDYSALKESCKDDFEALFTLLFNNYYIDPSKPENKIKYNKTFIIDFYMLYKEFLSKVISISGPKKLDFFDNKDDTANFYIFFWGGWVADNYFQDDRKTVKDYIDEEKKKFISDIRTRPNRTLSLDNFPFQVSVPPSKTKYAPIRTICNLFGLFSGFNPLLDFQIETAETFKVLRLNHNIMFRDLKRHIKINLEEESNDDFLNHVKKKMSEFAIKTSLNMDNDPIKFKSDALKSELENILDKSKRRFGVDSLGDINLLLNAYTKNLDSVLSKNGLTKKDWFPLLKSGDTILGKEQRGLIGGKKIVKKAVKY